MTRLTLSNIVTSFLHLGVKKQTDQLVVLQAVSRAALQTVPTRSPVILSQNLRPQGESCAPRWVQREAASVYTRSICSSQVHSYEDPAP